MKSFFYSKSIFSFLFLLLIVSSCSPTSSNDELPPGKMRLDLSRYGKTFSMVVPDSSSGDFSIIENNTQLEVRCVNNKENINFAISIEEGEGNMDLIRSDIQSDEINRFKRFLAEDSTMFVWESAITTPEFHFYACVGSGGNMYVIRDLVSTENLSFTERQILDMAESVRSVQFFSEEELKEKNQQRR